VKIAAKPWIEKYFPERQAGTLERPRKASRDMLNGNLPDCPKWSAWRDLPERYGPWQTADKSLPGMTNRLIAFLAFAHLAGIRILLA
jgi:transposase